MTPERGRNSAEMLPKQHGMGLQLAKLLVCDDEIGALRRVACPAPTHVSLPHRDESCRNAHDAAADDRVAPRQRVWRRVPHHDGKLYGIVL